MLTPIQEIILTCLLGPEDPAGFVKFQKRERMRLDRLSNPEKFHTRERDWAAKNPEADRAIKKREYENNRPDYLRRANASHVKNKDKPDYKASRANTSREWDLQNPGRKKEQKRLWREKNPGYEAEYAREREGVDLEFKITRRLRKRVYAALHGVGHKSARTLELLGCPVSELRIYLRGQFRPGMTWENYGPVWHIDHIRPCASFDLTDPAQQRECFHWSNLQPLFAEENLKKGDTYVSGQ